MFRRTGSAWAQQAYMKPQTPAMFANGDLFGFSVGLSADGNTLGVGVYDEGGSSRSVNGMVDNMRGGSGAAYVFTRTGATWAQQAYIKTAISEGGDSWGVSLSLSDDGNTLALGSVDEDCKATGVNPAGCDNDLQDDVSTGAVAVFRRTGATWSQQALFKASNTGIQDWFGVKTALSADGNTLVVTASNEDSAAQGIDGKQDDDSANEAGAVYLFTQHGRARGRSRPTSSRPSTRHSTSSATRCRSAATAGCSSSARAAKTAAEVASTRTPGTIRSTNPARHSSSPVSHASLTFRRTVCAALLLLGVAHAAQAQTVRAPADEVRAVRLTAPLRIDGRLDEEIYAAIPPIDGFVQQLPVEGVPATEPTELWVLLRRRQSLHRGALPRQPGRSHRRQRAAARQRQHLPVQRQLQRRDRHLSRPAQRLLLPDQPDRRGARPGDHRRRS